MADEKSSDMKRQAQGGSVQIQKKLKPDGSPDFMAMAEALQRQRVVSEKNEKKHSTARQLKLPIWPDQERAMPNSISRSALFSPIKRGRREMLDNVEIASRSDVIIRYTGPRLDMADADVFLAMIHLARGYDVMSNQDQKIYFNRGSILKALGRADGKANYEWLHKSIKRLTAGLMELQDRNKYSGFHLLDDYDYDKESGFWYVKVSLKIVEVFNENAFTLIDWKSRLVLKMPLAKWLQTYIGSHERGKEHRISFENLKTWSGSEGRMRDWVCTLEKALQELEKTGIIEKWEFGVGTKGEKQVRWVRSKE